MILKIMGRGFLWCAASPSAQGGPQFFCGFPQFFVDFHNFFVDRPDCRGPLVAGISSCVRRYGFGRRNPYFCIR